MKTTLVVTNSYCRLPATAPPGLIRFLDMETAYPVEGAEHSKAFRKGYWDGKEHLVKVSQRTREYIFPTGVLSDILKTKAAEDLEIVDSRRRPGKRRQLEWIGYPPRQYQQDTVNDAIKDRGIVTGRGMLNIPIRGGKTLIAARIAWELGYRTLFVVPDGTLLRQTANAFKEYIRDCPVGVCGDGEWDPQWITVVTFQSLISTKQRALDLLKDIDILFADEGHHLEAPEWRNPIIACDSFYKLALSATIFLSKERPNDCSAVWLKGCTGPILHRISMNRLIQQGYLMPPWVVLYSVDQPKDMDRAGWQNAYKQLIVNNEYRNSGIADLAQEAIKRGLRVLVDTGRLDQMKRIHTMLSTRGIRSAMAHGKIKGDERIKLIKQLRNKEVDVLVGTVLGEGVDIPELEVVINAEGMKSKKAVIQRMRNLTMVEGKPPPIFIDFADSTHPKLSQHSQERLRMYKGIRGFKLTVGTVSDGHFLLPASQSKE